VEVDFPTKIKRKKKRLESKGSGKSLFKTGNRRLRAVRGGPNIRELTTLAEKGKSKRPRRGERGKKVRPESSLVVILVRIDERGLYEPPPLDLK